MIIGHSRQLKYLDLVLKSGRIPHAFVFYGPEHIGKKLVAQAFIFRVNSAGSGWVDFFDADNQLAGSIASEVNPDVFVVRKLADRKEVGIEQIRQLKSFVAKTPFNLKIKSVLIDQAESLSAEAWVALLKTLEEPSANTIILIISSKLSAIPKTIISRSVGVSFQTLSPPRLKERLTRENVKIKDSQLAWLAGRPGLALGRIDAAVGVKALENLSAAKSIAGKFDWVERVLASSEVENILDNWLLLLGAEMLENRVESAKTARMMKSIIEAKNILTRTNANPRLVLENLVLLSQSS